MNSALVMRAMILRQRSLAGSWRSPEDERADVVALDLDAQRLAGRDQMLLADELIERPRTHAISERTSAVAGGVAARDGLEKAHKSFHHRDTETQRIQGLEHSGATIPFFEHGNIEID